MMIVATVVCAIACAALVGAEWTQTKRVRIVAKVIASFSFLVVGAAAIDPTLKHPIETASAVDFSILLGLVFGVAGDVFLLGSSKRSFILGLVAFLIGHLLYVLSFADRVPAREWLYEARPWGWLPVIAGIAALAWLWRHLGSMRAPVIIYVLVIVAMMLGAIAVASGDDPATLRHRLVAGAALFFASDLAVARDKFVKKSFVNRAWGLPAYYAGQLLIAWSLAY